MRQLILVFLCGTWMNFLSVNAQNQTISGVVSSGENVSPIGGVTVLAKGTGIGTVTNQDGFYRLEIPENTQTLVFSFVGMKKVEMPVEGSTVNVTLFPDILGVDEVVVVAYGSSLKQQFTGSVSTIRSAQLGRFNSAGFTKVLQGLSSGVLTTSGSGQPGEEAEIRIRGFSTFGDASPLIVLDGFPYDGNLSAISLSDIESVSVLKDAPATALYGSRAANGVIIITTKSGMPGTSALSFQVRYGISDRGVPGYDQVSIPDYYELQWEGIRNVLLQTGVSPEEARNQASQQLVQLLGGYNAYNVSDDILVDTSGKINPQGQLLWHDNWQDELFIRGMRREMILNASGGTEKSTYFLSGSLLDDEGIIKASNLRRFSVRANVTSRFNHWITTGINMSGSLSEQNYPLSSGTSFINPFMFTGRVAPIYPVYLYDREGELQTDADGNKLYDYGSGYGRSRVYGSNLNPLGTIELDERLFKKDVFSIRSFLRLELAEGLSFRTSLSADHYTLNGLTHFNMKYGDGQNFNGRTSRQTNRTFSYTSNQMLQFDKEFGEHIIQVLAGHENYNYKFNTLSATRSGFPFPHLVELDAAAMNEGSGSFEDNYRLESYLGKIDYAFGNRYFASFNLRTDGNSRFARDVRWGNYWGAGLAWMLSEESYFQDYNWLNSLRVKASYGQQGNDKIGSYYAYQGLYQTGINNIEYPGLMASRLSTPGLTWESLNSTNLGIEMKFLDRFAVNFEYYIRQNNDLLFEQPLPPSTGFVSIDANIARLSNKGYDLELSGLLISKNNVTWKADLNLGHFKNEIMDLPQKFIISGNKRWEVGRSIYDFWVEDYAGVNPETGKSQWFFDIKETDAEGNTLFDENGNPILSGERDVTGSYVQAGRYYSGSSIPNLFGGMNNAFTVYGFDVSVLVTFALGGKVMDQPYQWMMHSGQVGYNFHSDILNRWTPENRNTDVPAIDGDQNTIRRSTRFLADASYLSFRNVSVGYRIPQPVVSRLNLGSARLNITADNLKLITARKGLDPRQSFAGTLGRQYIPIRTLSIGLDVQF